MAESEASNGRTRVEYLLGVPLDANVVRQWPQMREAVHGSQLIGEVEGNFEELTLEVGRRLELDDVIVVEWTCNYGDGRLYRNVTIGELEDGRAVKVTDYWGEPTTTPEWRREPDEPADDASGRDLARQRAPGASLTPARTRRPQDVAVGVGGPGDVIAVRRRCSIHGGDMTHLRRPLLATRTAARFASGPGSSRSRSLPDEALDRCAWGGEDKSEGPAPMRVGRKRRLTDRIGEGSPPWERSAPNAAKSSSNP